MTEYFVAYAWKYQRKFRRNFPTVTRTFQRLNQHSHSPTVHLDIIKVFYLSTDAQEFCFKSIFNVNLNISFKAKLLCISWYIKPLTDPACKNQTISFA
jgi:hypothetical protein